MNRNFARLIANATRLTRAGDLQAATEAIQAALRSPVAPDHESPANEPAWVIDIDAVEVVPAVEIDIDAIEVVPAVETVEVPDAGAFITGRHVEAGLKRDYKLYVPPGHRGKPLPLVVMLHGCTQDPDDFAAGTAMNEAALELGFLVLYPAQAHDANPSRCWNWFKHSHQRRGHGEPALLAGMTREVMKQYDVDPSRVYVAGLSAGGAMAAILGDAYPELYAAVGVHSGLPPGAARDVAGAFAAMQHGPAEAPQREAGAPPTIVFHGDADTTVHPRNGEQVVAASAPDAAPDTERARSPNGREYTRQVWRADDGRVVAEQWLVHGAGHAWSGGTHRGSYTDARGPDATNEMLRFFFSNPRRMPH